MVLSFDMFYGCLLDKPSNENGGFALRPGAAARAAEGFGTGGFAGGGYGAAGGRDTEAGGSGG